MCKRYNIQEGLKDFEKAVRILAGSSLEIKEVERIGGRELMVSLIDHSLRDYLSRYLSDPDILAEMAPDAASIKWLSNLWNFSLNFEFSDPEQEQIAHACITNLELVKTAPWERGCGTYQGEALFKCADTPNPVRIALLLEWWDFTGDQRVAESIMEIVRNPAQGFDARFDGENLIDLFSLISATDYGFTSEYKGELLGLIEKALLGGITETADPDDLMFFAECQTSFLGNPQTRLKRYHPA